MKIIDIKNFKDKADKVIKLERGGLWENNEIEIHYNYPVPLWGKDYNCPHLGKKYKVKCTKYRTTYQIYANCPRVIVAINEGGFNSTGVCLDCLLEQLKNIK